MKTARTGIAQNRGLQGGGLVLLAVGLAAVLALYAPVRAGIGLERELAQARIELKELETLYPLYVELQQSSRDARWRELAPPDKTALRQQDIVTVPAQFSGMAAAAGMELVSVHPTVRSDASGERCLQVALHVAGPYERARDFLQALIGIPSMHSIGSVEISRETVNESIHCSVWLALE